MASQTDSGDDNITPVGDGYGVIREFEGPGLVRCNTHAKASMVEEHDSEYEGADDVLDLDECIGQAERRAKRTANFKNQGPEMLAWVLEKIKEAEANGQPLPNLKESLSEKFGAVAYQVNKQYLQTSLREIREREEGAPAQKSEDQNAEVVAYDSIPAAQIDSQYTDMYCESGRDSRAVYAALSDFEVELGTGNGDEEIERLLRENQEKMEGIELEGNFSAKVTGFGKNKPIKFTIHVEYNDGNTSKEWDVVHRYSDFVQLQKDIGANQTLQDALGDKAQNVDKELPGKHPALMLFKSSMSGGKTGKAEEGFLEERKNKLNKWLEYVCTMPPQLFLDELCLDDFFEVFWSISTKKR
eukprot:m.340678 g.340678  ORF g.340678 m.340678 type:complete len:356 (-) comp19454_c0_seq1:62-1129(-)